MKSQTIFMLNLALLLTGYSSIAQNISTPEGWNISFFAGVIQSKIDLTYHGCDFDYIYRPAAGVKFHYTAKIPPLGFETGLQYTRQGGKCYADKIIVLDYLSVPARYKFDLFHKFVFLRAGLYVSLLLKKGTNDGSPVSAYFNVQPLNIGYSGGLGIVLFNRYKIRAGIASDFHRSISSVYSYTTYSPGGSPSDVKTRIMAFQYGLFVEHGL